MIKSSWLSYLQHKEQDRSNNLNKEPEQADNIYDTTANMLE